MFPRTRLRPAHSRNGWSPGSHVSVYVAVAEKCPRRLNDEWVSAPPRELRTPCSVVTPIEPAARTACASCGRARTTDRRASDADGTERQTVATTLIPDVRVALRVRPSSWRHRARRGTSRCTSGTAGTGRRNRGDGKRSDSGALPAPSTPVRRVRAPALNYTTVTLSPTKEFTKCANSE